MVLLGDPQYQGDQATKASFGSTAVTTAVGVVTEASSTTLKQTPSLFLTEKTAHTMFLQVNGNATTELETFGKKGRDS